MLKNCKVHGECEHAKENAGTKDERFRCKKCRTEAVQRRRLVLKEKAVEYKGGKCCKCGYNKCLAALDFHHLDPNEKDFGIAEDGVTKSWEKVKIELDKCILVCSNCHREIHDELNPKKDVSIKKETRNCLVCSNKFETTIKFNKVYCSRKCYNRACRAKRRTSSSVV